MSFDPDRNWRDQLEAWWQAYLGEPEGRARGKRDLDALRRRMSAWLSDGGAAPEAWRSCAHTNVAPRVTEFFWAGRVEEADRALERQRYAREEAQRMDNPVSLRHIGFCPACASRIKVRSGRLVHHGYKRPGDGHIYGDCYGVDRPPHELSDGCARGYLADEIEPTITNLGKSLAYLKSGLVPQRAPGGAHDVRRAGRSARPVEP